MSRSDELSEAVASLANELVIFLDGDGRILLFNAACERASGRQAEEALGRLLTEVAPDCAPLLEAETGEVETECGPEVGARVRIVWRCRRLKAQTGGVALVALGRDVTQLRADEAQLRDRTARLESFLRATRDGIITIREDGIVTSFSQGAERLFGYAAAEVIGRNVAMLMPAPYAEAHDGYLAQYRRTGAAKIIGLGREVAARRRDGSTFPIHLMVEEGRIDDTRFFTGVVRDLSERRSLEHSLHEKQAQFEAIFEAAPDPVLLTDESSRIIMSNPAAARVFNTSTNDLRGRLLASLGATEADRAKLDPWRAGAAVETFDVQLLRSGGDGFPATAAVSRLHDVDGSPPGHVTIVRDVSEERRREEALRHSQKLEAIGQLTGGMAHDFNNLLTVIKGNLELLEMTVADAGAQELIGEARGAADMGAGLTQRMLAFARRQSLKPQLVDVNELVVGLSDMLRRTLGERIRLSTSLEPRLPPVLVDPAQLQNAVLNLALNARDAMPSGGGVALETHDFDEPDETLRTIAPQAKGRWVSLAVSDTGKGIAPEIRDRLFHPYVTTKPAGQGGGLGLAMVFGFVTQSGGYIAVESAPGAGAVFTIYLPQAGERPGAAVAPSKAVRTAPPGGGETVLLVEDNEGVRRLTSRRLKELGYKVIEAEHGQAALDAIERGAAFDLLLTDIVMPGPLDGFDLASEARARRPGVKLLYTSGYVDPGRLEDAEPPVGAELLRKPCSLAELAAAVQRALAG